MDTATPDYRDQRSSAFSIRIAAVEYDNALTRYERFSVSEWHVPLWYAAELSCDYKRVVPCLKAAPCGLWSATTWRHVDVANPDSLRRPHSVCGDATKAAVDPARPYRAHDPVPQRGSKSLYFGVQSAVVSWKYGVFSCHCSSSAVFFRALNGRFGGIHQHQT